MSEKYLDFSFEKTNSAYMLFYEWRSNKGGNEQRDQFSKSPCSSTDCSQSSSPEIKTFPEPTKMPSCSKDVLLESIPPTVETVLTIVNNTDTVSDNNKPTNSETESNLTLNATIDKTASDARSKNDECDIVHKINLPHTSDAKPVTLNGIASSSKKAVKTTRKSLLNKELEKWIWEDNRHYLEDRNIFEHTYFK